MNLGPHLPPAPCLTGEGGEAFTRILDSITDGFMVVDAAWRITYLNEAARCMCAPHLGDISQIIGKDHWEVFPSALGTRLEKEYRRAVAEGVMVEIENYYEPWNTWFAVRLFPIRDGGLSIYFRDVTEPKLAAEALRASEEKYRFLFNSIDEGFAVVRMIWSKEGRPVDYLFVEVNNMFEQLTGISEATGCTVLQKVPNLEARWFEIYGRVASTQESIRFVEGSDAMGRWFDVYAFPLGRDKDLVAILFTDITAKRQNEQEMGRLAVAERARVAELEALLDVMPIGIGIALDRECRDIRVNPSFAKILQMGHTDNASKTASPGERPDHFRVLNDAGQEIPDAELPMQVAAREGRPVLGMELNVEHKDGRTVRLLEYAVPLFDDKGEPRGSVGAFVDITERRNAADELARAKEAAEAASRAKDNFLAALSHELRTPLTPVLMAAEDLCDDPALPKAVHDTMCMMRRNISLEARLIDDLLDLTRIARGKFSLRLQEGETHSLMGMALEIVREEAQEKNLTIEINLAAQHTQLHCDPARLQQVFWNLFKNAVKFTPAGGRIHIRSHDEPGRVAIEVSDSGIGIPAEALERIFQPFEQAALTPEHRFGGLGLGLSISKAIVEMHGGLITAASPGPDCGAVFHVELPSSTRPLGVAASSKDLSPTQHDVQATSPPRGMRLLVVEDHANTLEVLARLLRRSGHIVNTASSVAAAKAEAATFTFDLLISDIGLPDGTGNELMEFLHAHYGLQGIALTGYGMEEDERRAQQSGFIAHLTKPVDFSQLRRTLEHVAVHGK